MRAIVALGAAVIALGACSHAGGPDLRKIERDIAPELEEQANGRLNQIGAGGQVSVKGVNCISRSENEARCFAELSGSTEAIGSDRVGLDVTIDPNDGSFIWETTE